MKPVRQLPVYAVLRLAAALAFLWMALATAAQESAPAAPQGVPFNVGYLPDGSDLGMAEPVMGRLKSWLESQSSVREALTRAGYGAIQLSPCDGPRDMTQRLNHGEFEVAFATSVIYARQTGPYATPIFQTRRPGDLMHPNQDGVMRQGVVFAGPASPYFTVKGELNAGDIASALRGRSIAVPSEDSAAGYVYPRWRMARNYGQAGEVQYLFCGTDEEVVKHVVSGLVELGACREAALSDLTPYSRDAQHAQYRVLFATDPFPTDPVLLHDRLFPARSDLGRELKAALRAFFNTENGAPPLRLENASGREYERLTAVLKSLADHDAKPEPERSPALPDAAEPQRSAPSKPLKEAPAVEPAVQTPSQHSQEKTAPVASPSPTATPTPKPTPRPKDEDAPRRTPALPPVAIPAGEARP